MFLFERLVGVATYASVLVLVCFSLAMTKEIKHQKRILALYVVLLSVLSFFYVPYETADLYRITKYVVEFQKYSFSDLIERGILNSEIGWANVLYWSIGKTGIPQLLPSLTTFICYSCIFYIVYKTAKRNQISGKNVAIALFFYMSIGTYMFVISGIRCMLGTSLIVFCFYRESVEKKFNVFHIPLYLIAALIHTFSVVLIAIRLLTPLFDKRNSFFKKMIYLVFLGLGTALIISYFSDYIEQVWNKAEDYLSGDAYSYIWEYVIAILAFLIIVFCVCVKYKGIKKKSKIELNGWIVYELLLFIISLLVFREFTMFHRLTTYIMPIIALPFLMIALQADDCKQIEKNKRGQFIKDPLVSFGVNVAFVSALILFITCFRGSLCSFKFFVL